MDEKIYKTYEEQLEMLKEIKLIISDNNDDSIEILKYENYYELINGYKELFLKSFDPEIFIDGCNINEIYIL